MRAEAWWRDAGDLGRVMSDLVIAEMARLRPGQSIEWPGRPWPADLSLAEDGLGADSLELLNLASAFAELLQMRRSGIEDYLLVHRTVGGWLEVARTALARFDAELAFRTSGTTGEGATHTHPLALLAAEARHLSGLLPGRKRLLAAVPGHHIYGFIFTVLLPRQLGLSDAVMDLRRSSPAALESLVRPGDLVVAHPAYWEAVLRARPRLPTDVVGTSSTAPCPTHIALGLRDLGLARLLEVFGSTETAGLGWRDDPATGFTPFPWWRFQDGAVEREGAEGEVLRRPVRDRLGWDSGRFKPLGRLDQVVQVGGVNVSTAAVRARLLDHPDIADGAVRLMRPEEGARLKVFVVPRPDILAEGGEEGLRARLAAWIDRMLPAPERPRAIAIGAELPTGEMGKTADWALCLPGGGGATIEP